MADVAVVLFADVFDQLVVRLQNRALGDGPWLGVSLRVVDGDLEVHMAEVFAVETLSDFQRVRHGVTVGVEPSSAVGSGGLDNQGVAIPVADRISLPSG